MRPQAPPHHACGGAWTGPAELAGDVAHGPASLELSGCTARAKQRPDDERVDGDHDDRPYWCERNKHEVRDRGDYRYKGAEISRKRYAQEDADTCSEHDDADDELKPSPAMIRPGVGVAGAW